MTTTTGYYGPHWTTGGATLSDIARIVADLNSSHAALEARMMAQVANPDTSGATLTALEAEVNQLKQSLRSAGIIAS